MTMSFSVGTSAVRSALTTNGHAVVRGRSREQKRRGDHDVRR
jgi:hypothetical protein